MNMHGVMMPNIEHRTESRSERLRNRAIDWLRRFKPFLLIVILPTALTAGYYYLVASNQYQSEAHFLVRRAGETQTPGIGLSQALSAATGISAAQSEAMSVADYLSSHDAVETLQKSFDLVARFRRPGADFLSRLRGNNPSPERVLKYYNSHVKVQYSSETGITILKAHTFTPDDSYALVEQLLALGELRVNTLNQRSYTDSIANAQRQVDDTEKLLAANQRKMTIYRQVRGDINPESAGNAQIGLIRDLTSTLSNAKAQLAAMGRMIGTRSPQYVALEARVRALQAQVDAQSARLSGNGRSIASDVSGYEDLQMRQDFLMKRYEAAAASLDKARDQAQRQQLYIVRVVQPNHPVKSLYPERGRIVFTVFVGLLLAYAIGWLIVAGTKEHAA